MVHEPTWYFLKSHLALIQIHRILLGQSAPLSLSEVSPLVATPQQFEALCCFERRENMLREQRGERTLDLVLKPEHP